MTVFSVYFFFPASRDESAYTVRGDTVDMCKTVCVCVSCQEGFCFIMQIVIMSALFV